MALSLAMMALIEPGDEVLYPDPGFQFIPRSREVLARKRFFCLKRKEQYPAGPR